MNCRLFNCGSKSLKYYTRMVSLNFFSSRYDKQSFYRNCETITHSIIVQNTFNRSGCVFNCETLVGSYTKIVIVFQRVLQV